MKLDNCSSILKIYRKVFLSCSFIKIFAFEVSAFLKNNYIKIQKLRISILWCWAIPWVVELNFASLSLRSKLCYRLVLKLTRNAAAFLFWMAAPFPDPLWRILLYSIQPGTLGSYSMLFMSMQIWRSDRPSAAVQLIPY